MAVAPPQELGLLRPDQCRFRGATYRFTEQTAERQSQLFHLNEVLGPWLDHYTFERAKKGVIPSRFSALPIMEDCSGPIGSDKVNDGIKIPLLKGAPHRFQYLEFGSRIQPTASSNEMVWAMVARLTNGDKDYHTNTVCSKDSSIDFDADNKKTPPLYNPRTLDQLHLFAPQQIDYDSLRTEILQMRQNAPRNLEQVVEIVRAIHLLGGDISRISPDVLPGKVITIENGHFYYDRKMATLVESQVRINKKFCTLLRTYSPATVENYDSPIPKVFLNIPEEAAIHNAAPELPGKNSLLIPLKAGNEISCRALSLGRKDRFKDIKDGGELEYSLTVDLIPSSNQVAEIERMNSGETEVWPDEFGQTTPKLFLPNYGLSKLEKFDPAMVDTDALSIKLKELRLGNDIQKAQAEILQKSAELLGAKIPPSRLLHKVERGITATIKRVEDKVNDAMGWKRN